ncbi:ATP-dependent DNA helicase [Trichonephila clavipes]|nr:ATP-dependent DNA helicase [Trichonephila clavipes]
MPQKRMSNLSQRPNSARAKKVANETFPQAERRKLEQAEYEEAQRAAETPQKSQALRLQHFGGEAVDHLSIDEPVEPLQELFSHETDESRRFLKTIRKLLEDDNHWDATTEEDVMCCAPSQRCELFAILICTCGLSNLLQLWDKYKVALSEDILHRFEKWIKSTMI